MVFSYCYLLVKMNIIFSSVTLKLYMLQQIKYRFRINDQDIDKTVETS